MRKVIEKLKNTLEYGIKNCISAEGAIKFGENLKGVCYFSRFFEDEHFGNVDITIDHEDEAAVVINRDDIGASTFGKIDNLDLVKVKSVNCNTCVEFRSYGWKVPEDVLELREIAWVYFRMMVLSYGMRDKAKDEIQRIAKEYFDNKKAV